MFVYNSWFVCSSFSLLLHSRVKQLESSQEAFFFFPFFKGKFNLRKFNNNIASYSYRQTLVLFLALYLHCNPFKVSYNYVNFKQNHFKVKMISELL